MVAAGLMAVRRECPLRADIVDLVGDCDAFGPWCEAWRRIGWAIGPVGGCRVYADTAIGLSLASFRRFWAVAASRNSSRAPLGPRNRSG